MAKEIPDLVAEARAGTGKGAARQARREGKVPGIVYGDGKEPAPIQIEFNSLLTKLRAGRFMSTLWNLKVDGQDDVRVICRGVQRDVVKDLPTHIDFMRLHRASRINLFIHVNFDNQEASPGLKKGGTLNVVRHEVELACPADSIPEELVFDLAGLEIGDTIRIGAFELPKGVSPTVDRDFVIATVAGSAAGASEAAEEAAGEAEA